MEYDSRDFLWNATFKVLYYSYYEELLAENLIKKWGILDCISKVLIAFTSTGSAIAGWALWQSEGFKSLWFIIAGLAAIFSILHSTLGVSNKLKEFGDRRRYFSSLRIELETFRHFMEIFPNFDLNKYSDKYENYRKLYSAGISNSPDDFLRTKKLETLVQDQLNYKIKEYIDDNENI